MSELEDARRLAVMRADLHRELIKLEVSALRERFDVARRAGEGLKAGGTLATLGAALVGFVAFRRSPRVLSWLPTAFIALRWLRRLLEKRQP